MKNAQTIMALFLFTQLVGLWVGITMVNSSISTPELQELNVAPGGASDSFVSSAIFLGYIIVGAVILVLILKFYKGVLIFKLMEALTLAISGSVIFYVAFLDLNVPYPMIAAAVLAGGLTLAKFFMDAFKNTAAVVASIGVGVVFGFSLDMLPASLFVVCLAIYDFVAVYITGHMVYMAKELGKRKLSFSVSAVETKTVGKGKKKKEEKSSLELGTGDMAIPLMLAISAYKLAYNPADAFAVSFGALLGLIFVLEYVTRKRTFMPALPPIILSSLACFAIVKTLLTGW